MVRRIDLFGNPGVNMTIAKRVMCRVSLGCTKFPSAGSSRNRKCLSPFVLKRRPPVEPPPEPEKKQPPIHPPKRDPQPQPIKDPPVPPLPRKDPQKDPIPIGDPPDQSDRPIRVFRKWRKMPACCRKINGYRNKNTILRSQFLKGKKPPAGFILPEVVRADNDR
jgi:hypothetical protein